MSDTRPPRQEPRPRRSGLGLILPLLLAGLLLYWIMSNSTAKGDNAIRGQTLQIFPFDTPQGPGVARCIMDLPDCRTELHIFPAGQANDPGQFTDITPDPNKQLLEMSRTSEPGSAAANDQARPWTSPLHTAFGPPVGCSMINDRDFVIFYVSTVTPESGQVTRAVGYVYPRLANQLPPHRLFVDPDVIPEVFVAAPPALLKSETPAPPTPSPANPPVDPAASETPVADQPARSPGAAETAGSVDAADPAASINADSAHRIDAAATPPPHPSTPAAAPAAPAVPAVTAEPPAAGAGKPTPATADAPVVWAFGRSASPAADRRDRLCVLEIRGDNATVRSISTGPVQITANAFLLTAVPLEDAVHLFWRVLPENSLPARVINHAIYDGASFQLLPAIQDAPTGFFTTTRFDNQILLTVLKPVDPADPVPTEHFRGKYELQYALLDGTQSKAPGTPAPPLLSWTTVRGLNSLTNKFDLAPVTRLDGRVSQLMLRGAPHGLDDEITLVTIPASLTSIWPQRTFINNAPQFIPDADKVVVFLMIGMLGLFGGVLLVAWMRPWRWLSRPPQP